MTTFQAALFSLIHLTTFCLYTANYRRLRKDRGYVRGVKQSIDAMPWAQRVTKLAFLLSTLVVLASFWISDARFGFFALPLPLRASGILLSFVAFLFLKQSLDHLGENYSPLFDTHRPFFIVKKGLYKYVRHPVYLCNILILLGYVLASGSVVVLVFSLWGWGYMVNSIRREEAFLAREFADYREYQERTWCVFPYVY